MNGRDAGWGEVDDAVSIRALQTAFDAGVTLVDSAPTYGAGHSERVIGQALAGLPGSAADRIVVATKFGNRYDEQTRTGGGGNDVRPETIRAECDKSLGRLGVEAIGIYQLHDGANSVGQAEEVVATCEELVAAGKIRAFGCAQDTPEVVEVFARSEGCVAVQTQVNVFGWTAASLEAARAAGLGVLARSPLAMGLLSGKYDAAHRPGSGDVRMNAPWWDYFDDEAMPRWLGRIESVRELLTADGRTLVQGALGYLLGLDPALVPLPGVRTEAQATENAAVLTLGPLPAETTAEITALMADSPERR